jgi:undecaprenyl-diphosphatase
MDQAQASTSGTSGRESEPPGRAGQSADERVERVLTEELGVVDSPETAERVVEQVERLAAGTTSGQRADQAAHRPVGPGAAVELAAAAHPGPTGAAAALTEAAAQVVAPTTEAQRAARAAEAVLPPRQTAPTPEAQRGRQLLREAMLRRMGPVQRLDTRVFLAVNQLPHPTIANVLADTLTTITTGGWIWLVALALMRIAGVRDGRKAFRLAAPCVIGATSAVEWPIKALFRRRRPFIDIVRALVIGRRPDGWSFPSGHTAAAFSGAWIATTVWPRRAPLFFTLAGMVGFSRIYVGAHYPGDVLAGASFGMIIAEAIRRPIRRFVR